MITRPTQVRLAVSAIVLALAIGACTQASSPGASGAAPGAGLTIAMVTHATPGDTYWDIIQAGANKAKTALGVTLKYSSDPDFTKESTLVQNAIDSKVDGIAMTAAGPDALIGAVQAAKKAGVPLVMFDSGLEDWVRMGALMYFGSDERLGGQVLGKRIAAAGGKHVLCVIHQEGSTALEARCSGVKEGVTTDNIQVNGADDASVNASIVAKLQQDPTIDWIVTMGAPVALVAIDAVKTANSKAKIATFDLNLDAAKRIKDGSLAMAVDAQPYLQGYLAVTSLYLYNINGDVIGGGLPTLTGPAIVDADNIAQILPFSESGNR